MAFKHCGKHHEQYDENGACKYCVAEQEAATTDTVKSVDVTKMTKSELLDHAAKVGVEVDASATKGEIVDAIMGEKA